MKILCLWINWFSDSLSRRTSTFFKKIRSIKMFYHLWVILNFFLWKKVWQVWFLPGQVKFAVTLLDGLDNATIDYWNMDLHTKTDCLLIVCSSKNYVSQEQSVQFCHLQKVYCLSVIYSHSNDKISYLKARGPNADSRKIVGCSASSLNHYCWP